MWWGWTNEWDVEKNHRERLWVTYHHLPSEELWDCALHTSSFHLVLHIVQQLKLAKNKKTKHCLSNLTWLIPQLINELKEKDPKGSMEIRLLTTRHSSCTSCCMKLSRVSHLRKQKYFIIWTYAWTIYTMALAPRNISSSVRSASLTSKSNAPLLNHFFFYLNGLI